MSWHREEDRHQLPTYPFVSESEWAGVFVGEEVWVHSVLPLLADAVVAADGEQVHAVVVERADGQFPVVVDAIGVTLPANTPDSLPAFLNNF